VRVGEINTLTYSVRESGTREYNVGMCTPVSYNVYKGKETCSNVKKRKIM
jgi:hypothetical protein